MIWLWYTVQEKSKYSQMHCHSCLQLPVKTLQEEELEQEEVFQAELDTELLEISAAVQGKDSVHVSDQRFLEVKKASVTDEEQKALQKLINHPRVAYAV